MIEAPHYSAAGAKKKSVRLPAALFDGTVNEHVLHRAVVTFLANQRQGTHDTKTRSEVSGGNKKPYRQKGTGRARQGSTRAPHWRHGGIVHGPTPRQYHKDMPQKMRRAAFRSALSGKAADGSIRVLEQLSVGEISTKQFAQWLTKLDPQGKVVFVLSVRDEKMILSARNLPNVRVIVLPGLSTYEVVRAETLVFTQDAITK